MAAYLIRATRIDLLSAFNTHLKTWSASIFQVYKMIMVDDNKSEPTDRRDRLRPDPLVHPVLSPLSHLPTRPGLPRHGQRKRILTSALFPWRALDAARRVGHSSVLHQAFEDQGCHVLLLRALPHHCRGVWVHVDWICAAAVGHVPFVQVSALTSGLSLGRCSATSRRCR